MAMGEADVDALIEQLWNAGGTDLLLTAGTTPLLRVNGELCPAAGYPSLTAADTAAMADALLERCAAGDLRATRHRLLVLLARGTRGSAGNAFRQQGSAAVALRMIPRHIPSFEELGTPAVVRRFAELKQGLVFVTGPTGSGKSTTLASIIDWINTNRAVHIITVEDPIEYVHEHKRSAVNQREVGEDTETFADALRSCLREDPDVILVGEMRDLESIRFALTLAETGHVVFGTLHTNDTAQAVDRLIDVFPGDQQPQIRVQLASTLTGVVYQRLVPRIDGGMVAAYEVLTGTVPVRNLVKEGKASQLRNNIVMGQRDGMQTLEMSLTELVAAGVVSYDEAVARSLFPRDVKRPFVPEPQ